MKENKEKEKQRNWKKFAIIAAASLAAVGVGVVFVRKDSREKKKAVEVKTVREFPKEYAPRVKERWNGEKRKFN